VTIGEFVDTCEFSREQNAAAAATRVPSGSAACSYSLLLQILSCAAQLAISKFLSTSICCVFFRGECLGAEEEETIHKHELEKPPPLPHFGPRTPRDPADGAGGKGLCSAGCIDAMESFQERCAEMLGPTVGELLAASLLASGCEGH